MNYNKVIIFKSDRIKTELSFERDSTSDNYVLNINFLYVTFGVEDYFKLDLNLEFAQYPTFYLSIGWFSLCVVVIWPE